MCKTLYESGVRLAKDRARGYSVTTTLNAFRNNHSLRIVAVVVTLLGWFVLSNHCALGRLAPGVVAKKEKTAHECCHNGSSQPAKKPADGKEGMQCCKSLHALVPVDAKLPVAFSVEIFTLPVEWSILAAAPELSPAAPATGPPPDVPAFAELVLHRSLHSHAPPFLA